MYAVDPYSGVGLFSAGLAERVGVTGRVSAVESDDVDDAVANLADLPQVDQVADRVDRPLRWRLAGPRADLVVLDPPRTGAKRAVVEGIVALARDVAIFAEHGYVLRSLRASTCSR